MTIKIIIKSLVAFFLCCFICAAAAVLFFISFKLANAYPADAGKAQFSTASADINLDGAYLISQDKILTIKASVPLPQISITPRLNAAADQELLIRIDNIPIESLKWSGIPVSLKEKGKMSAVFSFPLQNAGKLTFLWNKKNVSFIVWGDSRNSASIANGRSYFVVLELIKHLKKEQAGFAIINGDIVNKGLPWEYRRFLNQVSSIPFPIYVISGNHELTNNQTNDDNYSRYFGRQSIRRFNIGNTTFALLNIPPKLEYEKQLIELNAMEKGARNNLFVFMHYPPFLPENMVHNNVYAQKEQQYIFDLAKNRRQLYILAGHVHGFYEVIKGAIHEIISAGGGVRLVDPNNFHHYIRFDVEDQKINYEVIKIDAQQRKKHNQFVFWLVISVILIFCGVAYRIALYEKHKAA